MTEIEDLDSDEDHMFANELEDVEVNATIDGNDDQNNDLEMSTADGEDELDEIDLDAGIFDGESLDEVDMDHGGTDFDDSVVSVTSKDS